MQRKDVERLARTCSETGHNHVMSIEVPRVLRYLLDRAERAEAEQARLARAWEAKHDSMVRQAKDHEDYFDMTQRRMTKLVAERDAAFAAGQEEMRERAAEWCNGTAMTIPYGRHEPTHDVYAADEPAEWGSHQGMGYAIGIRALTIKPRP